MLVAALFACTPAKTGLSSPAFEALAVPPHPDRETEEKALADKRAADAARAPAAARRVASIAGRALGPFAARTATSGLVAWVAMAESGGGRVLRVVPTTSDGAPASEPRDLMPVPHEATSIVVRPAGGLPYSGWIVGWTALVDRGESISALAVAPDGTARGEPADVQRTADHVRWVDFVPTARGTLALWAEETASGDADLLSVALDAKGKPRSMPSHIARGVDRWQAVAAGDGAALALVAASPPARSATRSLPSALGADDATKVGKVTWLRLDADGRPAGDAIVVDPKASVVGDIDVVAVKDQFLLAWNDRSSEDVQVTLATVDAAGRVRGPARALDIVGGSSLVALASAGEGGALVWEAPHTRARPTRTLNLATVSLEATPEAHRATSIDVASDVVPELVADDPGYALLASTRTCLADAGVPCVAPPAPAFLRFDARLGLVQVEPLRVPGPGASPTGIPALAWGLACAGGHCSALEATRDAPAAILSVDLVERKSPFAIPPAPIVQPGAPHVVAVETVASGRPFEDVAADRLGDSTVVASLVPGGDVEGEIAADERHGRAAGAVITIRTLDRDGRTRGVPSTLTTRALATGGVAVAAGPHLEDGAAVAWVGRDAHDPQVHVAHLDRRGHRNNEIQLTTAKGDASSVALTWADDGWLVAWVDGRDGNGEVYATKVDRDLGRVGREERITNAPGDASDVALAHAGDAAWVTWSDPRDNLRDGVSDIYVAAIRPRDAKRIGDEVRVLETATNSRSPSIVGLDGGEGALIAWVEETSAQLDGPGAAFVAHVDRTARVVGKPVELPLTSPGRPTAVTLARPEPGSPDVRVLVARNAPDNVQIDALFLGLDGNPEGPASTLLDLDAPPTFEAALACPRDAVFFVDVGDSPADHRVRRAQVAWPR